MVERRKMDRKTLGLADARVREGATRGGIVVGGKMGGWEWGWGMDNRGQLKPARRRDCPLEGGRLRQEQGRGGGV